jgi:hypothetical protein
LKGRIIMTQDSGYVYLLYNPSTEGLVKIGKTTKDPEDRAKELSAATGVPTPFIVAYKAFFQDCTGAETFVHTLLNEKKISGKKEFFRTSVTDAVNAILQAEKRYSVNTGADENTGDINDNRASDISGSPEEIWGEIIDAADAHYHGWDVNILQDYDEALSLYKQAGRLGCSEAFRKIGDMYRLGKGVKENQKQAFYYYKKGAHLGDGACWGEMAIFYSENGENGNADKCWVKLFNHPSVNNRRKVDIGYFVHNFVVYMDNTRYYKHHTGLENFYRECKDGGL